MISFLLMEKIAGLFLMMFFGFVIVKAKVVQSGDSMVLSRISLYLIMPCVILQAFQVEFTREVREGLILAFGVSLAIHVLLLFLGRAARNLFSLNAVELASVIYSNAGNLIIPLVVGVIGEEWVIYTSAFLSVQLIFIWTHGKLLFTGKEKEGKKQESSWKTILLNPNMIAVYTGFVLLFSGWRFPSVIQDTMGSVSGMIGPVSMMITGMLVAGMPLKKVFGGRRVYLIAFLRMIACPALILLLMKLSHVGELAANGDQILLITFLATMTPAASTVTQFAQIFGKDAEYAGAINIITTLLCIVTMPVFVALYGWM